MAFACQRNSYLRDLACKVLSCVKVANGYEVILNDTVLFPEGGGQPSDKGKIGQVSVQNVIRRGPQAIHITDEPITEDEECSCEVDWERRFDHMQQHSAQHLFSAIADTLYKFKTVSWELGRNVSHVELNNPTITKEQIITMEIECNERIRRHTPVHVHYLTKDQALDVEEVRTRGLPADVVEPIRVIEMEGIEKNMCCGTHVSNLSDLQIIKLLHTESMRGGTRIFFIAGNRVLSKMSASYEVERKLTKLLSCSLDDQPENVEKLKNNLRISTKSNRTYLKEIAKYEAELLAKTSEETTYIFKHREDGDMDYIFTLLNCLPDRCKDRVTFICGGPVKTGGQFILRGPDDIVKQLSPRILELIGGKGGGKQGQLQGKATSYKRLNEVLQLIQASVISNPP